MPQRPESRVLSRTHTLEFKGPTGRRCPVVIDGSRPTVSSPAGEHHLYRIDLEAAMPFLLAHLKGPDQVLRKCRSSLGVSGTAGEGGLAPPNERRHDEEGGSRIAARAVALIREDHKAAVPLLIQGLKEDKAGYNHRFSGEAFGRWGPEAREAVPALIEALSDKAPKVRRTAASTLGRIGPDAKAALPSLRILLQDEDRAVRIAAGEGVEKVGGARK